MTSPALAPPEMSWVAAVRAVGGERPVGTGVVIDGWRVLTCAHVVAGRRAEQLEVVFPFGEDVFGPPVAVAGVRCAAHPLADVAVLVLAAGLPAGVRPARLRRPAGKNLVDRRWWAYGFSDAIGNEAAGVVGADLAHGWVRVDGASRYPVEAGFSGGGLWSPDYEAVVGLVGQALRSDGRCFTLHAVVKALPEEGLSSLADARLLDAAGVDAAASWGWSLTEDVEGRRHWRPRSRGVTSDAERGYRFTGRDTALAEIIGWLEGERSDRRALVVTGSPGVGKSAVLGRIVTTADVGVAAELPAGDTGRRAPAGSVSCAVHAKGKTALEVAGEIARAASAGLPGLLEDLVPALRDTLAEHAAGRRSTVVIDALDEASTPAEARLIVRWIVRPLVESCGDLSVGVIVGTRRGDDDGDLVASFGQARRLIDLDLPRYFAVEDLAGYALATLQLRGAARPGNPYTDPAVAGQLARRIAEVAAPNFLVAGLIARGHGLHDEDPAAPDSIAAVSAGEDAVAAALRDYLARVPAVGQLPAVAVLTPLAYAAAPGLTLELWQLAAEALTGQPVPASALEGFARGSAANFLIQTSTGAAAEPCYRLFHQALNDALLASKTERRRVQDQRALTGRFMSLVTGVSWERAPAYLRRSLAEHAAAGGVLDLALDDPHYLLHADLRRLIPLAATANTPAGTRAAAMLRATPRALDAAPAERLALFSVTEAVQGLGSRMRGLPLPAPYRAVWAHVRPGDPVATLEGHTGWVSAVCAVRAGGRELLASGGYDRTVRLWDPAIGRLLDTIAVTSEAAALTATSVKDQLIVGLSRGILAISLAPGQTC